MMNPFVCEIGHAVKVVRASMTVIVARGASRLDTDASLAPMPSLGVVSVVVSSAACPCALFPFQVPVIQSSSSLSHSQVVSYLMVLPVRRRIH